VKEKPKKRKEMMVWEEIEKKKKEKKKLFQTCRCTKRRRITNAWIPS
jgi:hypothetical protein